MFYWRCNAIVVNGKVVNVVVGEITECTKSAEIIYGAGAEAISVTNPDIPVQIGDSYDGTNFYRDGEKIEPIPNESQVLMSVKAKGDTTSVKANTNGMSIVDIENAILEIYDIIGG